MGEMQLNAAENLPAANDTIPAAEGAPAERFETIDYVRELFLLTLEQRKADKKKIRLLRACTALLGALLALFIAVCVVVLPAALCASDELDATLAVVRDADLDGLVTKLQSFTAEAGKALSSVGEAAGTLEEIDIDALNAAIEQLGGAVNTLSGIDVKTLNNAISNLNDTVEPFAKFFARFR